MLCIAAFFVLLVLSAVSAKHRKMLGRAWGCFSRKVTFRPCDTTFREDVENSLLAPLALRSPRLVKPASVAIEVSAWVMVISMVVSLYIVVVSGLNLLAYGTCNKQDPTACSLSSAQGCGIGSEERNFGALLLKGDVVGAFSTEVSDLGDTIMAIPNRFRTWEATDYVPAQASYLGGEREGLPVAVEVIDPGCRFCAQLFRNVKESGFAEANNVTYIVYPIGRDLAPRFRNSPLVAEYLTAIRMTEAGDAARANDPTDWMILERIFTGQQTDGTSWQVWFNEQATRDEARDQLHRWLTEAGYSPSQVEQVGALASSELVDAAITEGMRVVEEDIRTMTIPSLVSGGKLHRGVVEVADLAPGR